MVKTIGRWPSFRPRLHLLLKELWTGTGMTVVMVTHDLSEAFGLGTRMLVLDRAAPPDAAAGARITYDLSLGRQCLDRNLESTPVEKRKYA